jgi:hypothetical protein
VATNRIRGLEDNQAGPATVLLEGSEARPEVSRRHLAAVRKFIRDLS